MKEVQRLRQMLKWSRANILHLMGVYIFPLWSQFDPVSSKKERLQISNCKSRKLRNQGKFMIQVSTGVQHVKWSRITITVTCFYLLYLLLHYYYYYKKSLLLASFFFFHFETKIKQRLPYKVLARRRKECMESTAQQEVVFCSHFSSFL